MWRLLVLMTVVAIVPHLLVLTALQYLDSITPSRLLPEETQRHNVVLATFSLLETPRNDTF